MPPRQRIQHDAKAPKSALSSNLDKHLNKRVKVKFSGGREVEGSLKGHDQMANLVLDETEEFLQGAEDAAAQAVTRKLGLVVARGSTIMAILPVDGSEEIENPFTAAPE